MRLARLDVEAYRGARSLLACRRSELAVLALLRGEVEP